MGYQIFHGLDIVRDHCHNSSSNCFEARQCVDSVQPKGAIIAVQSFVHLCNKSRAICLAGTDEGLLRLGYRVQIDIQFLIARYLHCEHIFYVNR